MAVLTTPAQSVMLPCKDLLLQQCRTSVSVLLIIMTVVRLPVQYVMLSVKHVFTMIRTVLPVMPVSSEHRQSTIPAYACLTTMKPVLIYVKPVPANVMNVLSSLRTVLRVPFWELFLVTHVCVSQTTSMMQSVGTVFHVAIYAGCVYHRPLNALTVIRLWTDIWAVSNAYVTMVTTTILRMWIACRVHTTARTVLRLLFVWIVLPLCSERW